MSKLVFDFHIDIYGDKVSAMECEIGKVVIIPFGGEVKSELFTGHLLPGAADVQVTNAAGIRHMQAKYMFDGVDADGKPCKLFVNNNGFFEPDSMPNPFHACPTFMTDSKKLGAYLHQPRFRAEGCMEDDGLHIKIYDVIDD